MALAIKSACCCSSLRQACLIFLYINLILQIYGMLNNLSGGTQSQLSSGNSPLSVILGLAVCVVYIGTIISVHQGERTCWLTLVTVVLLIQSASVVLYMFIINATPRPSSVSRTDYSNAIVLINLIFLLTLAFELYSALVCYSYKVELEQKPAYAIPPGQTNITGPPNVYPGYPPQSAGQPPQYYAQPTQNPYVPPQCQTQPAQNPDIPPQYNTQPAPYPNIAPTYPTSPA